MNFPGILWQYSNFVFFTKKGIMTHVCVFITHFKIQLNNWCQIVGKGVLPYSITSVGMKNSGHTSCNSSGTWNFTMHCFSDIISGAIIIYIMATTTHDMQHKQDARRRARSWSSPFAQPVDSIASFAWTSQLQLSAILMSKSILRIVRLGFRVATH